MFKHCPTAVAVAALLWAGSREAVADPVSLEDGWQVGAARTGRTIDAVPNRAET